MSQTPHTAPKGGHLRRSGWFGGAMRSLIVAALLLGSLGLLTMLGIRGNTSVLSGTPITGTTQVRHADVTWCMVYLGTYFASILFVPPLLIAALVGWWQARREVSTMAPAKPAS